MTKAEIYFNDRSSLTQQRRAVEIKLEVQSMEGCKNNSLMRHEMAVCNDVIKIYRLKVAENPPLGPKPLILHLVPDGLPRVRTPVLQNQYDIDLTCLNTGEFCQIVYQFAHELGHVYIGGLSYATPLYRSNFFIESCCMAMSYISLDLLAKKWIGRPPFRGGARYVGKCANYRRSDIRDALNDLVLPSEDYVPEFIESEKRAPKNEFTENDRTRQKVWAIEIERTLKLKKYSNSWGVLCELGNATNEANRTDFDFWRESVVDEYHPLVETLEQISPEGGGSPS
jgi:hypothetical protein